MTLARLKRELEQFGVRHDGETGSHGEKMLNITRDTGELLALLLQATGAKSVLEIGTSNGYSTLWLAEGARRNGGRVTTIESDGNKLAMAQANFHRAALEEVITQLAGEAGAILPGLPKGEFELIFLDADRSQYPDWWPSIKALLPVRGLLVVDNAISHHHELVDWMTEVAQDPGFQQLLLPIGKGEWLLVKNP